MIRLMDQAPPDAPKPFSVMVAYRAWAQWTAVLDGGGYQVKHVVAKRDVLSLESAVRVLCEVYARAVFEVALAMRFDRVDSKVDVEVMLQIVDAFGQEVGEEVYARVRAVGPVVPYAGRTPMGAIETARALGCVDASRGESSGACTKGGKDE